MLTRDHTDTVVHGADAAVVAVAAVAVAAAVFVDLFRSFSARKKGRGVLDRL